MSMFMSFLLLFLIHIYREWHQRWWKPKDRESSWIRQGKRRSQHGDKPMSDFYDTSSRIRVKIEHLCGSFCTVIPHERLQRSVHVLGELSFRQLPFYVYLHLCVFIFFLGYSFHTDKNKAVSAGVIGGGQVESRRRHPCCFVVYDLKRIIVILKT